MLFLLVSHREQNVTTSQLELDTDKVWSPIELREDGERMQDPVQDLMVANPSSDVSPVDE